MGTRINEMGNIDYSHEGEVYGYLTIIYTYSRHTNEIRKDRNDGLHKSYKFAVAKCVCGNIKEYYYRNLKKGSSKSCGCYNDEVRHQVIHGHTAGGKQTPTYGIWNGMLERCYNSKHKKFKNYGGRGITVCDKWHSFVSFLEDMGERPGDLEIDRIDPNGNYEPSNCRWLSHKEQCRNKCNTVYVEYQGQKWTLPALAEKYGFRNGKILYNRIFSRGWTIEKAITTPTNISYREKGVVWTEK